MKDNLKALFITGIIVFIIALISFLCCHYPIVAKIFFPTYLAILFIYIIFRIIKWDIKISKKSN